MRTVKNVLIKKSIVHKLDNKKSNPVLSDFELELNDTLRNFISSHILNSLKDEKIRAAKFDEGRNIVKECTEQIFLDLDNFVKSSKEIAKQLFTAMQSNKNISSADIIICVYEGNGQNYLAILKLDYQTNYISEVKEVNDKVKIIISDKGITLPNTRQKLQKCVFIQKSCEENNFDLLLIDKQTKSEDKEIADFFAKTFLRCYLTSSDRQKTRLFYNKISKWVKENLKNNPEQHKKVMDSVRETLKNNEYINVNDFARGLFGEDQAKQQEFVDFLYQEGLTEFEFIPDKDFVEKKFKKRKIRTTEGIEINISDEDYKNPNKFNIKKADGNKYNLIIKNVEIEDWDG